jgi:glycosyltransferase involved in cell wall biosynthesis
MVNVLHTVCDLRPDSGGPARTVTQLCAALSRQTDTEVSLCLQSLRGEEKVIGELSRTQLAVFQKGNRLSMRFGLFFRSYLATFLTNHTPDIIHDHGIWLPTNHVAANIAFQHKIPFVVHTRGMLNPWAMAFKQYRKRLAWHVYQRRDLSSAKLFFATSDMEANAIRNLGFRQPIAVIPNGVDLPDSDLRLRYDKPADRQRKLVFIGRIHPVKGLLELLSAWSKQKTARWKLILAGPDVNGYLKKVLTRMDELGLNDSVEYRGEVRGLAKSDLLQEADLFVLPSFTENFGLVVTEALSFGVPVIATHGAPWRGLVENRCGWWVPAEALALELALREAIELDDEERFAMGARGYNYAKQFSWTDIARETRNTYLWLLGKKQRPDCVSLP